MTTAERLRNWLENPSSEPNPYLVEKAAKELDEREDTIAQLRVERDALCQTAQRRLELLRRAVALNSDCIACGNRVGSWLTDAQPHKPDCPLAAELNQNKPVEYTEPIHDHGAYGTAMKKEAK